MKLGYLISVAVAFAICLPIISQSSSSASSPLIREQREVVVGNRVEQWCLEWVSQPSEICPPNDESEEWLTCPCHGFAFGEEGDLDLVRIFKGKEIERLRLNPFFAQESDWLPESDGKAVLQRWPVLEQDFDMATRSTPDFGVLVRKRPLCKIMTLGDYDHDGHATEFVLQITAGPCGHRSSIVIGISKGDMHLHAFASLEKPGEPLVLEAPSDWEKVRKAKGKVDVLLYGCGDHGGEYETFLSIWFTKQGIHAVEQGHDCK